MTADAPIDWQPDGLRARLDTVWPGLVVEIAASVASSSTVLVERARAAANARSGPADERQEPLAHVRSSVESRAFRPGRPAAPAPCFLLIAEHQTAGRGRLGRRWQSARGASLTFSLSLPIVAPDWSGLSLAVGVALAEALDPAPRPDARRIGLKWPNDLWLVDPGSAAPAGRKLGGVLIEAVAGGPGARIAVIGIGLNIEARRDGGGSAGEAPEPADDRAVLRELDAAVDAPTALVRLLPPLAEALRVFERDGFGAFADRFAARDVLRDRAIRTTLADAPGGIARGVSSGGALRLEAPDGRIVELVGGEVSVRPEGAALPEADAC